MTVLPTGRQRTWIAATLLVCGAALRLEYLREFSFSPLFDLAIGADIYEYDRRAREIITGIFTPAAPDIHAPLYSWLLAGIYQLAGPSAAAARIGQTILNFAAWGLFYADWRRRENRAGGQNGWMPEFFLAAAMFAPAFWFFPAELISESLLLPLLLAAAAIFARPGYGWKFTGGILAGLAAITHPMTLLFAMAEVLWHAFRKPRAAAALIAAGVLLPILPVSISRSRDAGRPVLIQSNSAFNVFLGHNPEADGSCYLRPGARWRETHRPAAASGDSEAYFRTRAWDFIWRNPGRELLLAGRKALLSWAPEELPAGADVPGLYRWTAVMRHGALPLTAAIFLLGFAGFEVLWRKRRAGLDPAGLHLLILGAAVWLAQIATVTSGRYRLALLPGVFFAAAAAMEFVRSGGRPVPWRGGTVGLAVLAGAWLAMPARPESELEAASLIGEAWYRHGKWDLAEKWLTRSFGRDPDRDANLLGEIARRRGDRAAAERYYRYAATHAPQEAAGAMNLGMLAAETGRPAEAMTWFREAVRRNPADAESRYSLAVALERAGRIAEAEREYRTALALEPAHRRSLNGLGVLLVRKGELAEAERCFADALRLEPGNQGLRANLEIVRKMRRQSAK